MQDVQRAAAVLRAGRADADPQRAVDDARALGVVARLQRLGDRVAGRIDAGHGAGALVGDPDAVARGDDAGRPLWLPSPITAVGTPLRPSIRDTVPSLVFATHSAPCAHATPLGLRPTVIRFTTAARLRPGLSCVTVPEDSLVAQTEPPPQASWVGWSSRLRRRLAAVTGSKRTMLRS